MELWERWQWLYLDFNYIEALIWGSVGVVLLWKRASGHFPEAKAGIIRSAAIAFFFFGMSDLLEAGCESGGAIPLWIWAWKIFFGAVLVKCRYDYYGIDRTRLADRYSLFLLGAFLIVLLLVMWTWMNSFTCGN